MRILLVNGAYAGDRIGGSELQTMLLGQGLQSCGEEVHFVAVSSEVAKAGIDVIEGVAVHRLDKTLGLGHRRRALAALMETLRPDVCYVRIIGWLPAVVREARRLGIPVVANLASDLDLDLRPVVRFASRGRLRTAINNLRTNRGRAALGACAHVVAQTDAQMHRALSMGLEHVSVIRNMFPDAVPEVARTRSHPAIVWVGSIKGVKRPDRFVGLARALRAEDYRFVMAGEIQDAAYGSQIEDAVRELPNLSYLGVLSPQDAWALIATATVFVNTSDHEGFANTLIQAWLAEVPTVTAGVDPDGLIEQRAMGIVCDGDTALVDAIRRLCSSEEERTAMGRRAREWALTEHSLGGSIARYLAVFRSVIGDRK